MTHSVGWTRSRSASHFRSLRSRGEFAPTENESRPHRALYGVGTVFRTARLQVVISKTEKHSPTPASPRRGLSLLEVMLALTIFGMSMVALGELIRLGARCANDARELTTAQLYGESIMAEIVAGHRMPEPVSAPTAVEIGASGVDPDWLYSIQVTPAEQANLVSVTVLVERNVPDRRRATYSLVRWMPDPGIVFPSEEETAPSSTSTTPATTSGTSPTGGASGT
jgi:general secretion pathway protein I